MSIRVYTYPRLHVGLMDMGWVTLRQHGGAGFSVACLPTVVEAVASPTNSVRGLHLVDDQAAQDLTDALDRFSCLTGAFATIELQSVPEQHIGFGSKTALVLAGLRAAQLSTRSRLGRRELQELSGRGGTSGIGIHAFFLGGFIVDGGHEASSDSPFLPSSMRRDFSIPPLVTRLPIPRNWFFHLVLPPGARLSGRPELDFFNANTPVLAAEVLDSIAIMHHGLIPAVAISDLDLLVEALRLLHQTGFKHRELLGQSAQTRNLFCQLSGIPGAAVGLSSLGPLIYVITEGSNTLSGRVEALASEYSSEVVSVGRGRNSGHEVQVV